MLEFKNLSFGFEEELLFNNFNLKVAKGEFVSISGESGKGKTSLLKLSLGLLEAKSGEVVLFGESLTKNKKSVQINSLRKKLMWIPQNVNLPIAKVADLPFLISQNTTELMQKFIVNLDALHLDFKSMNKKNFADLSIGQKQRSLLALAFASDRELLVLDEPTSALDSSSIEELLKLVSATSFSIFSISHNFSWNNAADRLINL